MPELLPSCPRCSRMMKVCFRHADGHPFYGCPDFPRCRGTRSISAASDAWAMAALDAVLDGWEIDLLEDPSRFEAPRRRRRRRRHREAQPTGPRCPRYIQQPSMTGDGRLVACGKAADPKTGFCPEHRPASAGPAPTKPTASKPRETVNHQSFVEID